MDLMALHTYIFQQRPDVVSMWLDENQNPCWDISLDNQEEIQALVDSFQAQQKLKPVSPQQIRLALLNIGITDQLILDTLNGLPEPYNHKAIIEWNHALAFERDYPLVLQIAQFLNYTDEQLDQLWEAASQL